MSNNILRDLSRIPKFCIGYIFYLKFLKNEWTLQENSMITITSIKSF